MTHRRRWPLRAAVSATAAAVAARAAYAALCHRPPGSSAVWTRANHRGEPVTLLEGPAVAVAATAASALGPGLPARARAAMVVAGAGAAVFGGYDDLAGSGDSRGFRGHLGALRRGEVTTGAVKIGGIGATGLLAAALAGGSPADTVINAGLTAGTANLLNLFDLRPGRAIKAALAVGTLLAVAAPGDPPEGPPRARPGPAGAVAAPLGAAAGLLTEDLAERAMLGDAGANALGALLGAGAAVSLSRPARIVLLAGIGALTAASEVVSFTAVIERTPALRWLDMLGRRPAADGRGGGRPVVAAAAVPDGADPPGPEGPDSAVPPAGARRGGHSAATPSP